MNATITLDPLQRDLLAQILRHDPDVIAPLLSPDQDLDPDTVEIALGNVLSQLTAEPR